MRRYLPAVLRQNSMGWYIEYYAFNQISKSLERKRVRVNRERKRARTFAEFRSITSPYQLPVGWWLVSLCNYRYHAGRAGADLADARYAGGADARRTSCTHNDANARRAGCTCNGADASRAGNHDHPPALVFFYLIIHAGTAPQG